jgi:hypothetical protein
VPLPGLAPSALPLLAPISVPPISPVPSFGLTNDQAQAMQSLPPSLVGQPMAFGNSSTATSDSYNRTMGWLSSLTGGAVSAENDPRTWSTGEAVQQTDNALARIAQVNPALAQQLAEQRGRSAGSDTGGGFFGVLKEGLGTFLSVTHLDTALEVIGRTSHIVPEVIHDWGEESVWDNVGQALAGRSTISWDDVLVDNFGMERNAFTATLGFIGDVATDPLTYVTLGAGGVAKEAVASTVAKATAVDVLERGVVKGSGELVSQVRAWGATKLGRVMTTDEVAATILKTGDVGSFAAEKASAGIISKLKGAFNGVHPDAVPGVFSTANNELTSTALREVLSISDNAFRQSTTGGFKNLSEELATKFGVDRGHVESILKGWASRGTGILPGAEGRGLYQAGKASAAALGGIRMRLSVPVLGVRLAGARLLPSFLPQLDFQFARRFMAGISGELRLEKMVATGAADMTDLKAFWQGSAAAASGAKDSFRGGFDGLMAFNPKVAKAMAHGLYKHGGSSFYSMSENVGRLTAHLSPHAQVLRGGGLPAKFAADLSRAMAHVGDQLHEQIGTVTRQLPDGTEKSLDARASQQFVIDTFKGQDQAVLSEKLDRFQSLLPKEAGYGSVADYFDGIPVLSPRVAAERTEALELEAWFKGLGPDGLEAAHATRQVVHNGQNVLSENGFPVHLDDNPFPWQDELRVDDALAATSEAADEFRGVTLRSVDNGLDGDVIDEEALRDVSGGGQAVRGVQLKLTRNPIAHTAEAGAPDPVEELVGAGARMNDARAQLLELDRPGSLATDADRATAAERVRAAASDVDGMTRQSTDHVALARNPYRRNLRTGQAKGAEATAPVDFIGEIQAQYKPILDEIDGTIESLKGIPDPDVATIVRELSEHQEKMSDIVTRELRARGYDSLIDETDNGIFATILQSGDGSIPVSRLNPQASWVGAGRGVTARAATDEALSAVRRSKVRDIPGGAQMELERAIRETANMPRAEAEEAIKKRLSAQGIEFAPHQNILEVDPFKALDKHSRDTVNRVKRRLVGDSARRLESLGFGGSVWNGGAVGVSRYKAIVSETADLETLKRLGPEVAQAAERVAILSTRKTELLTTQADVAARALAAEYDRVNSLEQGVLGIIARSTDETASELSSQAKRLDDEVHNISEVAEAVDLGNGVYRAANKALGRRGITYYAVDDAGRVIGIRDVSIKEGAKDLHGAVSAVTAPSAARQGIGSKLHRAHWGEAGVWDADDPLGAAADMVQAGYGEGVRHLSKSGAALNASQVRKLADDIRTKVPGRIQQSSRELEAANLELTDAINEVNRLKARMTTASAEVRPALVPAKGAMNMTGMETLEGVEGFADMAMPVFMAQEFKHAIQGFGTLEGFHAEFRKLNAWWKSQVTYMWPGFHLRNAYGGIFNNMLGGVGMVDYRFAGRVRRAATEFSRGSNRRWAERTLVAGGDGDIIKALRESGSTAMHGKPIEELTYGDFATMTTSLGLTASNGRAFAEARLVSSEAERGGRGFLERTPGTKNYVSTMKKTGTLTENMMRTAAFSRGLRSHGTLQEARLFTMLRHGDYADLTDFEFNVVRDIIPFYKWMRTNIPFQVHQLLESPGKLLAVQKAQRAVFTARGLDYDEEKYKMPKWMGESFVIPTSSKDDAFTAVLLDLPMSDLYMGTREFVSSALPMIRPLLESFVYHQSTFSGKPIEGDPIPLNAILDVPGIREVLTATGLAKEGAEGKLFMSDTNQNLLGLIPPFSRAKDWIFADPDRIPLRMNAFASAGFGITIRPVDKQAMANEELNFYYSQVLPHLEHLRAMGYPLPTTDDIKAAYGSTDTVLTSLGIEPSLLREEEPAATAGLGSLFPQA